MAGWNGEIVGNDEALKRIAELEATIRELTEAIASGEKVALGAAVYNAARILNANT